jgi:hypothetical protein
VPPMDRRRTRRLPVVENLGFSTTEPTRKKGTEAFFLVQLVVEIAADRLLGPLVTLLAA